MQNKAAIAANATQHEISQEAAERQRQEEKASKQLERVQAQMAELIMPTIQGIAHFSRAYERAMFDCGVEEYVATYAMQWISPPTQPYVAALNLGNPESMKRVAASPFYNTLPPADLARLAADPTKQARWTNLVLHTLLPPLRELSVIFASKVRHICTSPGTHTRTVCGLRTAHGRTATPQGEREDRRAQRHLPRPRPRLVGTHVRNDDKPFLSHGELRHAVGGDCRVLGRG